MKANSKVLFLSLALGSMLFYSCKKDSDTTPTPADIDLAKVLAYPYSALTPAEQKVKLENESTSFLDNLNAAKVSSAIEAFQNLEKLLEQSPAEVIKEKEVRSVKETVQYADAYGVFTWDDVKKEWVKTASTSELKFIFPAKIGTTTNTAVFSAKAVSSGIAVIDSSREWNSQTETYTDYQTTYYLPSSATGILTINNAQAATIELTAAYKDNKKAPVSETFKITTNDGYVFSQSFDKATENKGTMQFTFNGKTLLDAVAKSTIKLDELIDFQGSNTSSLLGNANAYMKLTDNLLVVYQMDLANYGKEIDALEKEYDAKRNTLYDNGKWDKNQNYFTLYGQYEKEESDKVAAIWNKYVTAALVSTKDGSKIADLIEVSEKDGEQSDYYYWSTTDASWMWNGGHWDDVSQTWVYDGVPTKKYDRYTANAYLKFKDNTLAQASTYFSEGFDNLENKWEDFTKAFDR